MDRKPDVLVVEDDKMLNKLLCQCVQLAGFPVRAALDGGSALLAARERVPSLVLLDLMLPDTTGFEVCRRLKEDVRTSSATIMIVTALDDVESRQHGRDCGAAEYILKPFHPEQLISAIKKYAA